MYTVLIDKGEEGWQLVRTDQTDDSGDGMPAWDTRENALKFIELFRSHVDIADIRLAKLIDLQVKVVVKDEETE